VEALNENNGEGVLLPTLKLPHDKHERLSLTENFKNYKKKEMIYSTHKKYEM